MWCKNCNIETNEQTCPICGEATVEDISNQLDPLLQRMWGNQMYRIILSVKSKKNKETIKYSIQ